MFRKMREVRKEAEQKKLRCFFSFENTVGIIRYAVYGALIITMTFNLCGCALIGLLLRLAPLAAVIVEYSPPVQTEDGRILCVKSLRYVEQRGENTRIIKSEYFLVVLDVYGTEVADEPLEIGEDYLVMKNFSIQKKGMNIFILCFIDEEIIQKWEFKVEQKDFLILACSKPLFAPQIL